MRGKLIFAIATFALTGCASPQQVLLSAGPDQQSIIRNGVPELISQKKHFVMLRPNARAVNAGARPAFTVVVRNQARTPITLYETSIRAEQTVKGKSVAVRIFRYDDLVKEEQTRQTVAAVGAALSGAANIMAASNTGYVNTTGSVTTYGPGGTRYGTYSASKTLRRLSEAGKIRCRPKGTCHRQYAREDVEAYLSRDIERARTPHATKRASASRHSSTSSSNRKGQNQSQRFHGGTGQRTEKAADRVETARWQPLNQEEAMTGSVTSGEGVRKHEAGANRLHAVGAATNE